MPGPPFRSWRASIALFATVVLISSNLRGAENPVAISENDIAYTLDNGIVHGANRQTLRRFAFAEIQKPRNAGRARSAARVIGNTMSRAARFPTASRLIPKPTAASAAKFPCKGIANGGQMGSGPGGSVIADIEIRYALGRGDSGVYTYSIFSHPTNYPATSLGESRFCLKLNDDLFDWMTVDSNRNMKMISTYDWNHGTQMNMKETRRMNTGIYKGQVEHKYDYSANQFDVRAWGWSSSDKTSASGWSIRASNI